MKMEQDNLLGIQAMEFPLIQFPTFEFNTFGNDEEPEEEEETSQDLIDNIIN